MAWNPNPHSTQSRSEEYPTRRSDSTSNPALGTRHRPTDLTDDPVPHAYRRTWQPDSEASSCFLCHQRFSLLYRRHHCRLCGRICCANCSPEKIAVPSSYVVKPPMEGFGNHQPGPVVASTQLSWSHTLPDGDASPEDAVQVRICNQCLIQPVFTAGSSSIPPRSGPPPTRFEQMDLTRSQRVQNASGMLPPNFAHSQAPQMVPNILAGYTSMAPTLTGPHLRIASYPGDSRTMTLPQGMFHGPRSSSKSIPYNKHSAESAVPSSSESGVIYHQDATSTARRALKETDFCPICSIQLPPPDPITGSEKSREMHIQNCIKQAEHPKMNGMSGYEADESAFNNSPLQNGSLAASRRATRRSRMVVYEATEKDIRLNGDESECVICFEQFEVGSLVARLECLCRYHKECIQEWFNKKGNGDCPVHTART